MVLLLWVCVTELLNFVGFHEEFAVTLRIRCEENIESLRICDIEYFSVVGEIKSDYVLGVFFDDFGCFEASEHISSQVDLHYKIKILMQEKYQLKL